MWFLLCHGYYPIVLLSIDFTDQKVTYSLYIFGGDGLLTEYLLEPQRINTATDGEDAPIELHHTPKLCWRLLK